MCGIAGALWTDAAASVDLDLLTRMTDQLVHRGPDDSGVFQQPFRPPPSHPSQPGVALGHRRLSIIDLAGGHQPMANETETVWTVFNGEIYNHHTLRRRLEGSGHQFRTQCDTECIVHLYEDDGVDFVRHLNGMFAMAVWDTTRRRLVLARDRIGQKPLYYYQADQTLIFGSELKAILEQPLVPREIDPNSLDEFLTYGYVPHPGTIFRGIRKLPPGCVGVWENGNWQVRPYWEVDAKRELVGKTSVLRKNCGEQLRDLLTESVSLRLQADVPVGCFLSGGVDSSLITAIAQQLRQRDDQQPIQTFTIGFESEEHDERQFAKQVAQHLGTEHHEQVVQPDAVAILEKLVWHYDEPFGDSSAIPCWYLAEMTRQHVTVALSGDGGDELFAGYNRYRAAVLGQTLDRLGPIKWMLANRLWQRLPSSSKQRSTVRLFKRMSQSLNLEPSRRYLDWISLFSETRRAELYQDAFLEGLPAYDPASFVVDTWKKFAARGDVTAASLTDLETYLPCDLMTKVDIATMAHSLECRQPFLDYRLVEAAAAMPASFKFRGRRGKRILEETFGNMIPKTIWRRPKMGFGVPLDAWFRGQLQELVRDTLLAEDARITSMLRPDTVKTLYAEHQAGKFNHGQRLWCLLFLEQWLRRWL